MFCVFREIMYNINMHRRRINNDYSPKGYIVFRKEEEAIIWSKVLTGQISDGAWENDPSSNYKYWCKQEVCVNPNSTGGVTSKYTDKGFNFFGKLIREGDLLKEIYLYKMAADKGIKHTDDTKLLIIRNLALYGNLEIPIYYDKLTKSAIQRELDSNKSLYEEINKEANDDIDKNRNAVILKVAGLLKGINRTIFRSCPTKDVEDIKGESKPIEKEIKQGKENLKEHIQVIEL